MTTTSPRTAPIGVRLPGPTVWAVAFDEFIVGWDVAGPPATSRRSYRSALEHLARRVPGGPFEQTKLTLRAYVRNQVWAIETKRSRRATMVAFYDWAIRDELTETNPARQLAPVSAAHPKPRPIPDAIYQRALRAAAPRERLMLRLAAEGGMRRGEVAALHTSDLTPGFSGGWLVRVHGKRDKDRVIPLPEALVSEILRLPAGYVFPGNRAGHLSAEYVGRRTALVIPQGYTLHTLRHRFGTRAYQDSNDLLCWCRSCWGMRARKPHSPMC